jgi:hypothetical protein
VLPPFQYISGRGVAQRHSSHFLVTNSALLIVSGEIESNPPGEKSINDKFFGGRDA